MYSLVWDYPLGLGWPTRGHTPKEKIMKTPPNPSCLCHPCSRCGKGGKLKNPWNFSHGFRDFLPTALRYKVCRRKIRRLKRWLSSKITYVFDRVPGTVLNTSMVAHFYLKLLFDDIPYPLLISKAIRPWHVKHIHTCTQTLIYIKREWTNLVKKCGDVDGGV